MTHVECIGLPLMSITHQERYHTATYTAPADLSTLKTYNAYNIRLAKVGACMVRFEIDVRAWTVEVVWFT